MFKKLNLVVLMLCGSFILSQELTQNEQEIIKEKTLEEFAKIIFSNAMEAKRAFQRTQLRELPIENFATTAPRADFIANADLSDELSSGVESAIMHVSTDNQNSWQSGSASLLGTDGYENTWEGNISTNDGNSSYSYLSGLVNSEVLGESFGTILVSGSPHNENGNWPPSANLYATLATDPSGDASSNYDITAIRGTYKGEDAEDAEGNTYTDIERFYLSLSLNAACCDEGGLFGPWYLYGVAIVNPEAETAVAYAIGYGDGFSRLFSNNCKIYLNNKRINLIGRVSMDLVTVDLTNFINLEQIANKEFEFIGNKNPINTVCESINTIPYEILTNLGKRYQRRYIS